MRESALARSAQMAWALIESVGKEWEQRELAQMVWVLKALALMGMGQMASVQKVLVQMV